jgi:hypothetical protein
MLQDLTAKFVQLEKTARCKEDVLKLTRSYKDKRDPLIKLKAAVGKATKDVLNAKGCKKRVAGQAQSPATPHTASATEPSSKKAKLAKVKRPVFDACQSCKEIHVCKIEVEVALDDLPEAVKLLPFDEPHILTFSTKSICLTSLEQQEAVKAALEGLKKVWSNSPLRKNPGRAGQAVLEPAAELVAGVLMKCAGNNYVPPTDQAALNEAMAPTMFAIAAGRESVFIEKGGLASIRLATCGERDMVLCPLVELQKYVSGKSAAAVSTGAKSSQDGAAEDEQPKGVDIPQLCSTLLQLSHSQVLDLSSTLRWAHLRPGDSLYIPAGWISCELAAGGAACDAEFLAQSLQTLSYFPFL